MADTENIIYSILGSTRRDVQPMACSVELVAQMIFERKIPIDNIKVTKDIYPKAAEHLDRSPTAISRSVQRLVHTCWNEGNRAYLAQIIGRDVLLCSPKEMLFYLAYFIVSGVPFFEAMEHHSAPLF